MSQTDSRPKDGVETIARLMYRSLDLRGGYALDLIGEPGWDRTIGPLIKSQMLYR